MQTHIDDNISKFFKNNKKTLFEIFAKTYDFFFKKNNFVNIAKIKKNTIDDHEIIFSLHKNFVSKNQFDNFNKFRTIDIFFN